MTLIRTNEKQKKAEMEKKDFLVFICNCMKCTGQKSTGEGLSVMVHHDVVFITKSNLGHLTHSRDLLHRFLKHQLKVLILRSGKHHTIKSVHQPNHINALLNTCIS